jgi:hypothetical protein
LKSHKILREDEEILELSKSIESLEPSIVARRKILADFAEQAIANNT